MIDLPAPPSKPPVEALADCGLDTRGVTVSYDELAQSYVINISARAGASKENMQCVWDATWSETVQFENRELQEEYERLTRSRFEPLAIQSARETLEKSGLLVGLPKRADFTNTADYAVAIERHCGFAPNEMLHVTGDRIVMFPKRGTADAADYERTGCLFAALMASGETKIGIIGNAAATIPTDGTPAD